MRSAIGMRSLIGRVLLPVLVAAGCGNAGSGGDGGGDGGGGGGHADMSTAAPDLAMGGDMDTGLRDFAMMGDGGGGDMASSAMPNCIDYCKVISANCNGGNGELSVTYIDMNQCMGWCSKNYGWPAGASGAMAGNNIGCRSYHAGAAMANPALHCPHAGPSGGNTCGSWCDNYCYLALRNCTGPLSLYPDLATCMTACAKIPAGGMPNAAGGNTVQCRIYHLGVAGTDGTSAMTHCPHGSSTPTGPCM